MTQRVLVRRAVIAAAATATLALAACSGGTTASTGGTTVASSSAGSATATTDTSASSTPSGSTGSSATAVDAAHNDADVMFAQMMIVHHQGAIEMADLASTRASSQQVKDLAATIKAAQTPEIEQMTSWLQAWGAPTSMTSAASSSGMAGMDHGDMGGESSTTNQSGTGQMSGMMTPEQMSQLEAASGAEFDRMFLEMMIIHHQGAVEMAQTEIDGGANPDAIALAQSIRSSQTEEIATMQQLLQTL